MPTPISELIVSMVSKLILDAVKKQAALGLEELFAERKLRRYVESAVDGVVAPLLPFMKNEGFSDVQQQLLVETCVNEMRIAVDEPERLFRASLNGQKLFEAIHAGRGYPEAIRHEGLEGIYEFVGPQIGSLLCELTNAVDAWKPEKSREDYARFDEIGKNQRDMIEMMVAEKNAPLQASDALLRRMRRMHYQRIKMELDLTGLRGDQLVACTLEHMFVHPPLTAPALDRKREMDALNNKNESATYFLGLSRRSVLIGPPGAGKSTWTKWLQMQALSTQWNGFPIRIELRAFVTQDLPSYSELLRKEAGTHVAEELTSERIRHWVDSGRIVFVLDGFDELPPARRDVALQWIDNLAEAAPVCPIVLTSRPLTTDHLERATGAWRKWTVGEFDKPRIVRYIEAWYQYMPLLPDTAREVNARSLATAWRSDPTLRHLTANPLLLSTLLVVHHLDGELPRGRAKLYERYIEGMLGGWDSRRKIELPTLALSLPQKRRLLCRLALDMHLAATDQIDEDSARGIIEAALREMQLSTDGALVLDTLRERSGLLIGPGTYGFAHKSIGEFMVAEAIVEGNERDRNGARVDRMTLFRNRHEDRWNTVLFFWAGLAPAKDVEDFIGDCMAIDDWREVLLAVSLAYDQGVRLPVDLPETIVQRLVEVSRSTNIELFAQNDRSSYIITGDASLRCPIPMAFVRGMSIMLDLRIMLRDWHLARHFDFRDVADAQGDILYTFWSYCAFDPQSLEEWRQCLLEAPVTPKDLMTDPPLHPDARWLVPLYYMANQTARLQSKITSPQLLLATFTEAVPALQRTTTFVLLLGIIMNAHDVRTFFNTPHYNTYCDFFRRYIELWGEYISTEADETWLRETTNTQWDPWLLPKLRTRDLLVECLSGVSASLDTGALARTLTVEHVTQTIEQLMARRAVLIAQKGQTGDSEAKIAKEQN